MPWASPPTWPLSPGRCGFGGADLDAGGLRDAAFCIRYQAVGRRGRGRLQSRGVDLLAERPNLHTATGLESRATYYYFLGNRRPRQRRRQQRMERLDALGGDCARQRFFLGGWDGCPSLRRKP